MNKNNMARNADLRAKSFNPRAIRDIRIELRSRRWSPKTLTGYLSNFILEPEHVTPVTIKSNLIAIYFGITNSLYIIIKKINQCVK